MNEVNGKSYVGSSKDLKGRWSQWRSRKPLRYKSLLRLAIEKYGIENFTFIILEECESTKEALETLENHYLRLLKPEYNILQQSYAPTGRKHPHTEETKAKIRAKRALQVMQKGRKTGQPAWNRGLRIPRGMPTPVEVRTKISASLMGHAVSDETRARMSANRRGKGGGMTGRHHTEETKAKIRATKAGLAL